MTLCLARILSDGVQGCRAAELSAGGGGGGGGGGGAAAAEGGGAEEEGGSSADNSRGSGAYGLRNQVHPPNFGIECITAAEIGAGLAAMEWTTATMTTTTTTRT